MPKPLQSLTKQKHLAKLRKKTLYIYTHTRTHTHTYIYIYIYVCMYVCMYACMHACMHACMYVCKQIIPSCIHIRITDRSSTSWLGAFLSQGRRPAKSQQNPFIILFYIVVYCIILYCILLYYIIYYNIIFDASVGFSPLRAVGAFQAPGVFWVQGF